jgi:hypothetical protein
MTGAHKILHILAAFAVMLVCASCPSLLETEDSIPDYEWKITTATRLNYQEIEFTYESPDFRFYRFYSDFECHNRISGNWFISMLNGKPVLRPGGDNYFILGGGAFTANLLGTGLYVMAGNEVFFKTSWFYAQSTTEDFTRRIKCRIATESIKVENPRP